MICKKCGTRLTVNGSYPAGDSAATKRMRCATCRREKPAILVLCEGEESAYSLSRRILEAEKRFGS